MIELQVQHGFSFAHAGKGQPHASRAVIGVKGHAAIAFESAASRGGIYASVFEVKVAQTSTRVLLNCGEESFDDRGRLATVIERSTAPARPEPGMQRVARCRDCAASRKVASAKRWRRCRGT